MKTYFRIFLGLLLLLFLGWGATTIVGQLIIILTLAILAMFVGVALVALFCCLCAFVVRGTSIPFEIRYLISVVKGDLKQPVYEK